jgi:methylmalonyl-CoA mutase cobalamin-binding subunit
MKKKLIVGAAIGDCVHVAGVVNFLNLAEQLGFQTVCLGPAVALDELLEKVAEVDPAIVAIGYRLTPENCRSLLDELVAKVRARHEERRAWLFGGTEPCVEVARATGLFQMAFASGISKQAVVAFLRGEQNHQAKGAVPPVTLVERIAWKAPYPLLRHHFGRPTIEETLAGVVEIARAECLDVISLGTDQNAQEHFFRPSEMDPTAHGAGGVPVRTAADLEAIYAHSRLGNHPLVRCYSGTRDTMLWAPMLAQTIHNAWCAIPLFWYTRLDGRSPRPLREAIPETQSLMRWHAANGIPVEMNESHHWSLRDAPDVIAVVAAFLAAYNARAAGVRDYVQQLMFNNPPNTSPIMDLGKMLAKLELVEALQHERFHVWRETRGGLTSYPPDPAVACGHLAATVCLQMQLKPHIVHIVGPTEAHHATTAAELIQACRITDGAISQCLLGLPDMTADPRVQQRKAELIHEAGALLRAIAALGTADRDPYLDADVLARAVEIGLLDAPHLRGNAAACGTMVTRIVDGACVAVNPATGKPLTEAERIDRIMAAVRPLANPQVSQAGSGAVRIGRYEGGVRRTPAAESLYV